jgi:hypothetical protein
VSLDGVDARALIFYQNYWLDLIIEAIQGSLRSRFEGTDVLLRHHTNGPHHFTSVEGSRYAGW